MFNVHYQYLLLCLFGWPSGIVLGNLIANLFWMPLQWAGLHLKLRAHSRHMHDRFDKLEEMVRELQPRDDDQ